MMMLMDSVCLLVRLCVIGLGWKLSFLMVVCMVFFLVWLIVVVLFSMCDIVFGDILVSFVICFKVIMLFGWFEGVFLVVGVVGLGGMLVVGSNGVSVGVVLLVLVGCVSFC